jgi:hypothetical protein
VGGVVTEAVEVEHSPCGICGENLFNDAGSLLALIEVRTSNGSERGTVGLPDQQSQLMTNASRKAAVPLADGLGSPLKLPRRKGQVSGDATEEPWLQG